MSLPPENRSHPNDDMANNWEFIKDMKMSATGKFFVMMYSQDGNSVIFLSEEDDEVALFDDEVEAHEAANDNAFARAFDYEVHEVGNPA